MRSGRQHSTSNPIHLYGSTPVGGSRADKHTSQRNSTAQASSAQGGRWARERVVGDAPARRHAAAQPNLCTLAATPHTTRLPPLAAAEAHCYPQNRGLPGVEPEQPNPSKETASATDPAVPARCYSCPTTSCPPQNTHQLQRYGVTGAILTLSLIHI